MFQENRSHSREHTPFLRRHPDIPTFTDIRVFSRFCCIGCDFQPTAQAEPNEAASSLSGSCKARVLFSVSHFEREVNQLLRLYCRCWCKEPKKWTLTLWRCPMASGRALALSQVPHASRLKPGPKVPSLYLATSLQQNLKRFVLHQQSCECKIDLCQY